MRIRISDLPPQGLTINDSLDLESISTRLREGRDAQITILESPKVEMTVMPTGGGAEARGTVSFRYQQACSTCLEDRKRSDKRKFKFVVRPRPAEDDPEMELYDDLGVVYIDGDYADFQDAIIETVILSLSLFWHPERDADEKCLECGKDCSALNKEVDSAGTSFGDLLKIAQGKK